MGGSLTLQSIDARAVLLPLRRPIVSKVGQFDHWPMILIDIHTREGIVGHSYLEPYLKDAMSSIIPLVQTLGASHIGKPIAPLDFFSLAASRKTWSAMKASP